MPLGWMFENSATDSSAGFVRPAVRERDTLPARQNAGLSARIHVELIVREHGTLPAVHRHGGNTKLLSCKSNYKKMSDWMPSWNWKASVGSSKGTLEVGAVKSVADADDDDGSRPFR